MALFKVIPFAFVSVLAGAVVSGNLGEGKLFDSTAQWADVPNNPLDLNVTSNITSQVPQPATSTLAPAGSVSHSQQMPSYSTKVEASSYKYKVTVGGRSYTGHGTCNIYKIKGFAFESEKTLSFDDYEFTHDKSFLGNSQPIWCAPNKYFYIFNNSGTWVVMESSQPQPQTVG